MAVIVVAVGILGRYVAPYPPDEMFGAPFSGRPANTGSASTSPAGMC